MTFTGANSVAFAYSSHTKLVFADNGAGDVDVYSVGLYAFSVLTIDVD